MSMFFGLTGRLRSAVFLTLLALMAVPTARAQTDPCELPLSVPDMADINVILQPNERGPGILVTWPEPDPAVSTCTALTDTAGLGIVVHESGYFADQFDRTITFTFNDTGTVSSASRYRFVCAWNNTNQSRTGRIGGEINLSNSGGLWMRDTGGAWTQRNGGLPSYLPYTNIFDLAAADDGTMVAVVTGGAQPQNDPEGVFRITTGGEWAQVAPEQFGRNLRLSRVAMRPSSSDHFAVGTQASGLFVTTDGGQTFAQWTSNLSSAPPTIPSSFEVTALMWTEERLVVSVLNYGTFVSTDDGASFSWLQNLVIPDGSGGTTAARVRALEQDPSTTARILAGVQDNGIYESLDAGATWSRLVNSFPGPAIPTVLSIDADPADGDHLVMGTLNQGIWYTNDHGATWVEAVTPFIDDDLYPVKPEIWDFIRIGSEFLCLANDTGQNDLGLLETADGGQTWTVVADQPWNRRGRRLVATAAGLQRPTNGGGIYLPETPISVTASQTSAKTDPQYAGLEFGVSVAFSAGSVPLPDADGDGIFEPRNFYLNCQVYQGWIVWKSERGDPDNMTMAGRFDRNNPESCIEGYCGDDSYVQLPNCFSERRAACFQFHDDGTVSFFDGDIYNAFTYFYSVTPFDYGDVSLVTDPISLAAPMVFPARFPGDPAGDGDGNRQSFQVNSDASAGLDGDEIYVYPNPLRREAGIAGSEGEEVIWTNLPPASQIEVFTLAGDHIATLPEEGLDQTGGNIYWITRNDEDELLASGVYIWRVIMPERGDFWGKLVIIR